MHAEAASAQVEPQASTAKRQRTASPQPQAGPVGGPAPEEATAEAAVKAAEAGRPAAEAAGAAAEATQELTVGKDEAELASPAESVGKAASAARSTRVRKPRQAYSPGKQHSVLSSSRDLSVCALRHGAASVPHALRHAPQTPGVRPADLALLVLCMHQHLIVETGSQDKWLGCLLVLITCGTIKCPTKQTENHVEPGRKEELLAVSSSA